MRGIILTAAALVMSLGLAIPAQASGGAKLPDHGWSFEGMFGEFDKPAIQRGFQVYQEVCAGCHGVKYLSFRNLAEVGFGEDAVKAIAAEYDIEDGPDDEGEMYDRPGLASDRIPGPFPNDNAARASNNGALPPDLSLMAKARKGGANYIYALMTGYDDEPDDMELADGMAYNHYFPGNQIAMSPPLFEDGVEYVDGTEASVEQMAEDITHFLMWAAEPNLEVRKRMGLKVVLFLLVLTALLYASKRMVWANVKH
jgi:ubiquinol-cytochrome c reductase cytochrome c1 subunit